MSANGGETGVLLRFLRARKLNVSKALAMFRETLEWRAAEDVDALMRAPLVLDEFRENAKLYPASYHGRDVHGRPVYIERTGTAKFAEVIRRIGADGFLRMHLRAMEYQARVLLPAASADAGEAVTQMCNVIDVSNLSLYDTVSRWRCSPRCERSRTWTRNITRKIWASRSCATPRGVSRRRGPSCDRFSTPKQPPRRRRWRRRVGGRRAGKDPGEGTRARLPGGDVSMRGRVRVHGPGGGGETPEVLTKAQVEYAECFLEEEDAEGRGGGGGEEEEEEEEEEERGTPCV